LEDQRRGYLMLLFTDGKSFQRDDSTFVFESLSGWPMVAWMDFREKRFWDETISLPVTHGIPIYPASRDGLIKVTKQFLTEQEPGKYLSANMDGAGVLPEMPTKLDAHVEFLLGDALLWAQDCALIQPVSLGLADALRREFYPHLPPERMGRLYALPDTSQILSTLCFSKAIQIVLRNGFKARRSESGRKALSAFLMRKIEETKPETEAGKDPSLQFLKWERVKERFRMESDPNYDMKRLAELALTPLGISICEGLGAFGFEGEANKIPPIVRPQNPKAWRRLKWLLKKPKYSLREEPLMVSSDEFRSVFGLGENQRPLKYIENEFKDRGDGTIADQATGVIWQKSGSNWLGYEDALAYVEKLNRERFAGYDDWRLPTIEELMSLLEPKKQSTDLYIDPIFDEEQSWCLSSDKEYPGAAWLVYFLIGDVVWDLVVGNGYVRAVRS